MIDIISTDEENYISAHNFRASVVTKQMTRYKQAEAVMFQKLFLSKYIEN